MGFDKQPARTLPGILDISERANARWPYLTVLIGALPGRMFRFRSPVSTIGRSMDCDINLNDLGVSRVHARLEQTIRGLELFDLGSTNGTWHNGAEVEGSVLLRDGDKLRFGPNVIVRFNLQDAVDEAFQRSQFEAMTRDRLTGCFNRLYFDEELRRELSFARRSKGSVTVGMIDLDHFKAVNDTWGHAAGDIALVEIAKRLRVMLRQYDLLARLGGEEFVLLMRDTDLDVGITVAQRLRRGIEQLRIPINDGRDINVTISIGVASLSENMDAGSDELLRTADLRLYQAKAEGRNRVVGAGALPGSERQTTRRMSREESVEVVEAIALANRRKRAASSIDGVTEDVKKDRGPDSF